MSRTHVSVRPESARPPLLVPRCSAVGCGGEGCPTLRGEGWHERFRAVDGAVRGYLMYVPASDPGEAKAAVFIWHGLNGSADEFVTGVPIQENSGDAAIVVVPKGLPLVGDKRGWLPLPGGRDFEFFDAMCAELVSDPRVEEMRVFSTGGGTGPCFDLAHRRRTRLGCPPASPSTYQLWVTGAQTITARRSYCSR